ncbi:16S rRNA (adenine(1518)-N(6)/adenine(1519)-N(6))-dimethyltransferase RsmA [Myxococcota bacterium]|nr:16S rRNA (adenine(1518)-N(6)/adenine(1519)-N(6))-dimethyltransferase RsmA [Myxococcota bacterium]
MTPSARADVRDFLGRHGLRAGKDRGQNFLVDPELAHRLVELAGVGEGDTVVEIGPGLGQLTRALATRARRVIAIEVDAGLVRGLREDDSLPPNVELIHADALEMDLVGLARDAGLHVRLVANLPYSLSGPLLRRLIDLREFAADWSVMVQREVADRLLASPGTKSYGSLTVLHCAVASLERLLHIHPRSFHPVPRVRSSFVRVRPLETPLVGPGDLESFERLVRGAFSTRRKTLVNALRTGLTARYEPSRLSGWLHEQGLDPRVRAEGLTPAHFASLRAALFGVEPHPAASPEAKG